jgi:uncharacterized protein (TIGR02246 family)
MKRAVIGMLLAVMVAPLAFAQTKKQTVVASTQTVIASTAEMLAEARRAIDKGNAQWIEAWAKSDPAMAAAIFAEDGVMLAGSGKVFKGRQQIAERQKALMQAAGPGVKVTVTTVKVWLDGDTAYETGKYVYNYQDNGKPATDEGRYVTMWRRQKDGSWKLAMDMGVPQE